MDKINDIGYPFSSGQEISFVWDFEKERLNILKHGVDFRTAMEAFKDPRCKIFADGTHSQEEERFICLGRVAGEIMTVRFTYRQQKIRIFGAGFWRKGRKHYEDQKE